MFYGLSRYQNISNGTKGLQKLWVSFSYDIHLNHACHKTAKNFGNIKINYFLWCDVLLILPSIIPVLTTRCQPLHQSWVATYRKAASIAQGQGQSPLCPACHPS